MDGPPFGMRRLFGTMCVASDAEKRCRWTAHTWGTICRMAGGIELHQLGLHRQRKNGQGRATKHFGHSKPHRKNSGKKLHHRAGQGRLPSFEIRRRQERPRKYC